MEVIRMLERSAWQREMDAENAQNVWPGFQNWKGSGEYSGQQVGFNREGRWWKRSSESEYRGESKFGFRMKEAA
jgi:hypothetical protein